MPRLKKTSSEKNQVIPKITHHYVKRTDIFQYVWKAEDNINEHDLKQVGNKYPIVKELNKIILDFKKYLRTKALSDYVFSLNKIKIPLTLKYEIL